MYGINYLNKQERESIFMEPIIETYERNHLYTKNKLFKLLKK